MHPRAAAPIASLDLQSHPEGGHHREIVRSADVVTSADGPDRAAARTSAWPDRAPLA